MPIFIGAIAARDPASHGPAEQDQRETFVVQAPFDADPYADAILRSSDGIDFRVIKSILAHSSPFFKTLFTLPQPAVARPSSGLNICFGYEVHEGSSHVELSLPVVPMLESSAATLDALLRILYPIVSPGFGDLRVISDLVEVGQKYDIDLVLASARDALCKACTRDETNAMKVYVIACLYRLEDIARMAAYAMLRHPFSEKYITELDKLSGTAFYRIFDYHRKVVAAVRSLFLDEQYGATFCYYIANAIVDRSEACPHRKRGDMLVQTYNGLGFVDVADQVYFLGWWISLRSTLFAEIAKGPISDTLVTYELLWTEAKDCCPFCQKKVEFELRCGLLGNLNKEMKKLVSKVELELPWN